MCLKRHGCLHMGHVAAAAAADGSCGSCSREACDCCCASQRVMQCVWNACAHSPTDIGHPSPAHEQRIIDGMSDRARRPNTLKALVGTCSGVRTKKFRGGGQGRGSGGGAPPRMPENFRKVAKRFLKKIAKMHYFSIFFKPCVTFSRVWMKNKYCWEILRHFSMTFLRKFRKIHYFTIFFEKPNKTCVNFSWTRTTNCMEIFRKL